MKNGDISKRQVEHQLKLEWMRSCMIYGKSYEECELYFKSKGFKLGRTQFTDLRNELKSAKNAKEWFSKEALFVIEEDHMLSVERIRMLEDRLMLEFEQVSSTPFYSNWDTAKSPQKLTRNKNHDGNFMLRLIAEFRAHEETKTKMFSATPLVQELMEVHRRQEENEKLYNYADRKLAS